MSHSGRLHCVGVTGVVAVTATVAELLLLVVVKSLLAVIEDVLTTLELLLAVSTPVTVMIPVVLVGKLVSVHV